MAIKDIFKMIKADRYTQDGREELIKAQEAVTEDVTYKPGDISRKTGLQKQPDGSWAPVKNAPAQKKSDKTTPEEMAQIKELKTQYSKAKTDEERSAIANKVNEIMGVNERMSAEAKKETELRSEAASGDPQKRKALFDFQAQKASDEEIDMVLSAKERGVNHPADFIEAYKEEKAKRAGGSAPSANWEKDIPNASNEELENIVKLEEKLPRMSEQSRSEFAPKIEKAKSELAKRKGSAPTESDRLDAEVGLHEGEENLPDFVKGYSILSEEHDQDARAANAKIYPSLQPLVRQREPFMKKRIEAFTKLRDNPSNPKARADFVDASNAISQIDADIDREYKKVTGDSAPRTLTGDCKIRIKKSK